MFGFKINVELLILMGVIFIILAGHTVGGCCNQPMWEGFTNPDPTKPANQEAMQGQGEVQPAGNLITKAKEGASKQSNKAGKEGFVGANTNYGESSVFDLSNDPILNTANWSQPNLTVVKGQPVNADVKQFLERKQQPLPLPQGEMTFFAKTEFKPECCPNTYSNSMGCACMTSKDYNYLIMRGGNNVPYSEY